MRLLDRGTMFAGRYRVDAPIAVGSTAVIYQATHVEIGKRCALKVLTVESLSSGLRTRFTQEARVSTPVKSEYLVDVIDAGIDTATSMPYIAMEYLEGTDLLSDIAKRGRMAAPRVVKLLSQVATVIDKCHALGIVHRDLKPENLFLMRAEDGSSRIKVLDFGIAKVLVESTLAGERTAVIGTPLYMAPEQFKGLVSPATDIYSIGMIAYTLLVGMPYWNEESQQSPTAFAFMARIVNGPQQPASTRAAKLGVRLLQAFDAWFSRCTAAEPRKRFGSAIEAVFELAVACQVPPPSLVRPARASGSGKSQSPDEQSRRRRRLAIAIAGAVLAVSVVMIVVALLKPRPDWSDAPLPASSTRAPASAGGSPAITVLGEPETGSASVSAAASARAPASAPASIRTPGPIKGVPTTWSRY